MFITKQKDLERFYDSQRIWQGIPGVEVTKGGRIFSTLYSGRIREGIGNYVLLIKSDDGKSFSEPIAAAYKEGFRCYDSCVWIDPTERLWFIWSVAPKHMVWATVCDNPDADELIWCEPFEIAPGVMMYKPTVLSTGEWLFPIAIWKRDAKSTNIKFDFPPEERKSFVYKTVDNGKTFVKLGGSAIPERSFDEHMILERQDKSLAMYVRKTYGIGVSYSFDRGKTWTEGENSGICGPSSRFFIGRLKSGRVLLVNHDCEAHRSHMTAMLSEDDGETWKYKLLLDERNDVSYPDATEGDNGYIYITYDRERGVFANSLDEAYSSAREIIIAKITEEDIIKGEVTDKGSRLKWIVSKLGRYAMEKENPYNETARLSEDELVEKLVDKTSDEIISSLFESYQVNCISLHKIDNMKLDALIDNLEKENSDKKKIIRKIISLIRSVSVNEVNEIPIVQRVKSIIQENVIEDITLREIADKVGISQYYLCHLFKKATGLTIIDYKNEMKLTKAKDMLINSDKKIGDISFECGFGSESYFSRTFMASENISPSSYRKLLKRKK